MALLDRMRNAVGSNNRIEALSPDAAPLSGIDPINPREDRGRPRQAISGVGQVAAHSEPEAISRTYYVEDRGGTRRFYHDYQRKSLAMRADDNAISSRREDLTTIRAMLTLAEARGWSEIKVAGSADFRRQAWIEAQARGMAAQGHRASDLDRQEADRRRAERGRALPGQVATATNDARPVQGSLAKEVPILAPTASGILSSSVASPGPVAPQTARTQKFVGRDGRDATRSPARRTPTPTLTRPRGSAELAVSGRTDPARSRAPVARSGTADTARPPAAKNHRTSIATALAELSPDGQLILAALAEKIDRQMTKLSAEAKLETKAFAAAELLKKEKREGPVVLSPDLRLVATSPETAPAREAVSQAAPTLARQVEPEPARRSRSR